MSARTHRTLLCYSLPYWLVMLVLLQEFLDQLGFNVVAFGCATCIGNSGPLDPAIETAIEDGDLVATAVLSGNRNFEGRISPHVTANYLASPPLVVAYAITGSLKTDLNNINAMGSEGPA